MKRQVLEKRLKNHLLNTVGKKPTRKEMNIVNKEIRSIFNKLYDKPNKSPLFIKNIYDKGLAKLWNKVVANENFAPEINLFEKFNNLNRNSNVTSIASGLAVYELFIFKEFFPKGKLTCIDISREMSKYARKFTTKLNLKRVRIANCPILELPLKSQTQDLVLARRTGLSNDRKWISILKEANRVLKENSNSRFIYTVDRDFAKSKREISYELSRAGLALSSIKEFGRGFGDKVCMIVAKK